MNNTTLGIVAALCTVAAWTIGTFSFAKASRLAPPASVNRVRLLFACLVLGLMTCVFEQLTPLVLFTSVLPAHFVWFGISGIVGLTLGDYFAFTAYKIIGSRRASLFSSFAPAAALLSGFFITGETISLIGMMGIGIATSGVLMLTLSRNEQQSVFLEGHGSFTKGILFAFLGAVCQGLGLVLAKRGFQAGEISAIHATWIRMFIATISVYLIGLFRVNLIQELKQISFDPKVLKPVLIGTLFGPVIGVSLSLFSANKIEASITQTILSLLPVSVTFATIVLYKEKVQARSILAVVISIIGVMVLVWRNRF